MSMVEYAHRSLKTNLRWIVIAQASYRHSQTGDAAIRVQDETRKWNWWLVSEGTSNARPWAMASIDAVHPPPRDAGCWAPYVPQLGKNSSCITTLRHTSAHQFDMFSLLPLNNENLKCRIFVSRALLLCTWPYAIVHYRACRWHLRLNVGHVVWVQCIQIKSLSQDSEKMSTCFPCSRVASQWKKAVVKTISFEREYK